MQVRYPSLRSMQIVPLTLKQANALVADLHRHHEPAWGHRFSIGVEHEGKLVGAAIMARPVARMIDQYKVLEVTRLVTDGTKNACSILYAAAARIAREMGFCKIQTYILNSEPGISLLASGWTKEADIKGSSWNRPNRGRVDKAPTCDKQRWAKVLNKCG